VVQVVQKQELRATFEKYGIVDEVYIAQAGGHAHCSCFSTPSRRIVDPDPHGSAAIWLSWIRIRLGRRNPDPGAWKLTKIHK
jgi:hypothetical protein